MRENGFLEASQKLDSGQISIEEFHEMLSQLSGETIDAISLEFESVNEVDHSVVDIIKKLRHHYKIALLSNSPSKLIRTILEECDLEKHFDEIVISSEVGLVKPSREIFELIIDRLGLVSSEILFIDDSKHHIEGAEKVGINSLRFVSAAKLELDLQESGIRLS